MKKFHKLISLCLIKAIILINTINSLQAQENIFPSHFISSAKFAYLIDFDSAQTIFSHNGEKQMVPSSMTKIMTAYIVFEKLRNGSLKLDDKFIVSKNAAAKMGSKMFVRSGQMVSVEDLLKGVIVLSGNDACIVLAEGLNGSEAAFVVKMNEIAKKLGLSETNFENATGWPDKGHVSSARDLAVLSLNMIEKFPEYYYFHSIKEFEFNKIKQKNRNGLLGYHGIDGVKTGSTEAGGHGIVMSAIKGNRRLIAVVNGLKSYKEREIEANKLLNFGFINFKNILYTVKTLNTTKNIRYADLSEVSISPNKDVFVTVPSSYNASDIKIELDLRGELNAPLKMGDVVGEFKFLTAQDGKIIKKAPAIMQNDVKKSGFFKAIYQSIKYFFADLW